jgi:hypothetical protein
LTGSTSVHHRCITRFPVSVETARCRDRDLFVHAESAAATSLVAAVLTDVCFVGMPTVDCLMNTEQNSCEPAKNE